MSGTWLDLDIPADLNRSATLRVHTHRYALELALGRTLADGMEACHSCDNPPCCNPAHLFRGNAPRQRTGQDGEGPAQHEEGRVTRLARRLERR